MAAADIKRKHEDVKAKFGVKVRCKHCEAVYQHNTTTTLMMYNLNSVMLHSTLVNVSASSSQPAITSVWAQRSRDAQQ